MSGVLDVPFNPRNRSLVFQVENIFVNPSAEGPGFEFNEDMEITGNFAITINSPQQLVAVNAVPEPSFTLLLAGFGLCAIGGRRIFRVAA